MPWPLPERRLRSAAPKTKGTRMKSHLRSPPHSQISPQPCPSLDATRKQQTREKKPLKHIGDFAAFSRQNQSKVKLTGRYWPRSLNAKRETVASYSGGSR